jgi:hypothetical protein
MRGVGCVAPSRPGGPISKRRWPSGWPRAIRGWSSSGGGWPPRRLRQRDAEAARILDEHRQLLKLAEAARALRRLRPDEVASWTSDPPFPGRTTYIPVIGVDLAAMPGLGDPEWVAMQDRAVLVVHPELGEDAPVFGSASVYGAPPDTPPPDRSRAPEGQGWAELAAGDFLVPWLLHIPQWEVAHR